MSRSCSRSGASGRWMRQTCGREHRHMPRTLQPSRASTGMASRAQLRRPTMHKYSLPSKSLQMPTCQRAGPWRWTPMGSPTTGTRQHRRRSGTSQQHPRLAWTAAGGLQERVAAETCRCVCVTLCVATPACRLVPIACAGLPEHCMCWQAAQLLISRGPSVYVPTAALAFQLPASLPTLQTFHPLDTTEGDCTSLHFTK